MNRLFLAAALACMSACAAAGTPEGKPLVVLIAGKPSHEHGAHEHNAGVQLFAKALAQGAPELVVKVHLNEDWPSAGELDQADTILLYADAGGKVLTKDKRLREIGRQMDRGAGFIVLHWGLDLREMPKEALAWLGGFKDPGWSVNPMWHAEYKSLPEHPVTRGVQPFDTVDEWYFHMRFSDGGGKLLPILTDLPTVAEAGRGCCDYESNPDVVADLEAGKPQTTAWAWERTDGGRAFGFTGGHFHIGWGQDDQRKLLLNAILWTAGIDVPANGVESNLTAADLQANLDPVEFDDD